MNIYQKLAVATSGVALLTTMRSAPATAATFNFSYVGAGNTISPPGADVTASGVLTTDPYDPATNSYKITGITGTRNGVTIDSLLPTNSFLVNDNLLISSDPKLPQLTENGFDYTAGGQTYNVFHSYDNFEINGNFTGGSLTSFSATPAAVPEPSSGLGILLGMSVLTGGTLLKQKLKQKKLTKSSL